MGAVDRPCVLDPAAYTRDDLAGTLAALGPWWAQLVAGRDEADALVVTQAADAAATVAGLGARLGLALPPPPEDDLHEVIAWFDRTGEVVAATVRRADAAGVALAAPAVVTAVDDLLDAGDRLRAAGILPPSARGTVVALHRGEGGVPKHPVDELVIAPDGVVGDRQAVRRHHGRPWQAVSLWSAEVIERFAVAGHPIAAGRAGENVTVAGLPWADVRSGSRLQLGDALVEVSVFALPCTQNARWFVGGHYDLMHHRRGPVSRVYASVLRPGRVRTGDPAVLEPDELYGSGRG